MKTLLATLVLGAGFAAFDQPALAQSNDDLENLRRCALIENEAVRHACYDRVLQSDQDDVMPEGMELPSLMDESASVPTSRPDQPLAVNSITETERVREDFGRPVKKKNDPDSIDVTVISARINARGRYIYRTEDGQLWRQIDTTDPRYHNFPLQARIRKGLMGTFFIKVEGVAGAVRVRRIN